MPDVNCNRLMPSRCIDAPAGEDQSTASSACDKYLVRRLPASCRLPISPTTTSTSCQQLSNALQNDSPDSWLAE